MFVVDQRLREPRGSRTGRGSSPSTSSAKRSSLFSPTVGHCDVETRHLHAILVHQPLLCLQRHRFDLRARDRLAARNVAEVLRDPRLRLRGVEVARRSRETRCSARSTAGRNSSRRLRTPRTDPSMLPITSHEYGCDRRDRSRAIRISPARPYGWLSTLCRRSFFTMSRCALSLARSSASSRKPMRSASSHKADSR